MKKGSKSCKRKPGPKKSKSRRSRRSRRSRFLDVLEKFLENLENLEDRRCRHGVSKSKKLKSGKRACKKKRGRKALKFELEKLAESM